MLGNPFGRTLFPTVQEQVIAKKREEEDRNYATRYDLERDIAVKGNDFYHQFGLLEHPSTRLPVKNLTSYQSDTWDDGYRHKYRLRVKSQKTGMTTSSLIEDFQRCVIPTKGHELSEWSCMGREVLLIAQKFEMAKEHLSTLYQMLTESSFANYIIDKPIQFTARKGKESTKANMLYLQNPENPKRPTRIIALGPRASGVWSWKNVKHIHMSDVAAVDQVDDSQLFGAAFSRLANTRGSMLIESPPRGQRGKVWEIYQQSELQGDEAHEEAKFDVKKIYASQAVDAGLIDQAFLDQERVRMGALYGMFYECEFLNPFTSWYTKEMVNYDNSPDYVSM